MRRCIRIGSVRRLANPGTIPLEMKLGSYMQHTTKECNGSKLHVLVAFVIYPVALLAQTVAGLRLDDFEGPPYKRISHLQGLLSSGRLGADLRWSEAAMA